MRIGDAAAAVGVTTRTLRYYEQRGLLTARRTSSGQREYEEEDIRRLRTVRELLDSGLTIGDVRHLLDILDALPDLPQVSPHHPDTELPATESTTCLVSQVVGVSPPHADTPTTCVVPQVAYRRLAELDDRIRRLTDLRTRLADQLDERFAVMVHGLMDDLLPAPTADSASRCRFGPCFRQGHDCRAPANSGRSRLSRFGTGCRALAKAGTRSDQTGRARPRCRR